MNDDPARSPAAVSRRTALAGLGVGGLGLALAATARQASAQEATPDALAGHPIVGTWLAHVPQAPGAPGIASPSLYTPDGHLVLAWPVTGAGPQGVTGSSTWVGSWEPVDDRGIRFTAVQALSDASGAFLGTAVLNGHPRVSDDGEAFVDDSPESAITIYDPAGAEVTVLSGGPPVTATRIRAGSPVFPAGTPEAATPTG